MIALVVALFVSACGAAATPSPTATSTSSPIPEASFTGGTANARLTAPAVATWAGGWCSRGIDDAWLAVNVGSPNGAEYFGLVAGQSPYTASATRKATGGGTFGGDDAVVTWRHDGKALKLVAAGLAVQLATDLSGGTFTGALADGTEVRGTFSC